MDRLSAGNNRLNALPFKRSSISSRSIFIFCPPDFDEFLFTPRKRREIIYEFEFLLKRYSLLISFGIDEFEMYSGSYD